MAQIFNRRDEYVKDAERRCYRGRAGQERNRIVRNDGNGMRKPVQCSMRKSSNQLVVRYIKATIKLYSHKANDYII